MRERERMSEREKSSLERRAFDFPRGFVTCYGDVVDLEEVEVADPETAATSMPH